MRPILEAVRRVWTSLGPRVRYWCVLGAALAFFAWAVTYRDEHGRRVPLVQAVIDEVGMRQVEAHADAIERAARESAIDPLLVAAICFHESRGRGGQVSSAGALGLMQLKLAAASDAARRLGLEPPDRDGVLHDDELNLRLGAAHLAWLLEHSEGWPLEQVLVSYNAGRARLFEWIDAAGGYHDWVRAQENAWIEERSTSGALRYARRVLATMESFRERGRIG